VGARQKLNAVYVTFCAVIAAAVGVAFQSWLAFAIALAAGMALKAHDGGIRPSGRRRRRGTRAREKRAGHG
jgi:putative effector of murein hydrolase